MMGEQIVAAVAVGLALYVLRAWTARRLDRQEKGEDR